MRHCGVNVPESPFLYKEEVGERTFMPNDSFTEDPVRQALVGKVFKVIAMTNEGIVFIKNPNSEGYSLAFGPEQGVLDPPME